MARQHLPYRSCPAIHAQGKHLYLTAGERVAFLAAATKVARPVRTLCGVLHTTGCRVSEALALTPEHVDLPLAVEHSPRAGSRTISATASPGTPPTTPVSLPIVSKGCGTAAEESAMPSSQSLAGLMKWLTRDPWRDAFADVLEQHVAGPCEAAGIAGIEELGELVGAHWATTLWGCAFEDFLTREVEGAGNIVDDYLKRRGWKETAVDRAYMAALRSSTMSLYEASDIQPGQSFLARDLLRGGEPIRVTEHTATKTIKPWDRLAMRIVEVRGKTVIGGGLLPFEHELSRKNDRHDRRDEEADRQGHPGLLRRARLRHRAIPRSTA